MLQDDTFRSHINGYIKLINQIANMSQHLFVFSKNNNGLSRWMSDESDIIKNDGFTRPGFGSSSTESWSDSGFRASLGQCPTA